MLRLLNRIFVGPFYARNAGTFLIIILLAFGTKKSAAIAAAVEGPVTSMSPASILQMHPVAKCIVDRTAAARLARIDYYRWVYDQKPDWQKF